MAYDTLVNDLFIAAGTGLLGWFTGRRIRLIKESRKKVHTVCSCRGKQCAVKPVHPTRK